MIRVAIADDHPELRLALRLFLSRLEHIEIVAEAGDGREAVECVERFRPDVLVMDVEMPKLNGFLATAQIAELSVSTRVILISMHGGDAYAEKAAEIGAQGFVPKDNVVGLLPEAIEVVYRGERFFPG